MKHSPRWLFFFTLLLFFSSCSREYKYPTSLERLTYKAEMAPREAMAELEGMAAQMAQEPERVRMRYELLRVKARDKAYIPHTDDSLMLNVLDYFERHGTDNERMEANYYMGSVYRDMHESPKTVVYYRRATEIAENSKSEIDNIVLSLIYAQLANLYYDRHQDEQAVEEARRAYELAQQHNFVDVYVLLDLARSYRMVGNADSAKVLFQAAQEYLPQLRERKDYAHIAEMGSFALYNEGEKAAQYIQMLEAVPKDSLPFAACIFIADYYNKSGDKLLASDWFQRANGAALTPFQSRAVSCELFELYRAQGNQSAALQQAERYIALTDSIQQQEKLKETQQADNEFRYNQRAEKDRENRERAERNERRMWLALSLLLLATVVGTWGYFLLSGKLRERTRENAVLRQRAEASEHRLLEALQKGDEQQLPLSEVAGHLRDSAHAARKVHDERIWQQLYGAVEAEHPGFGERLAALGVALSEETKRICYLFRAGFSRVETGHLLGFSGMTAGRRRRAVEHALGCPIEEV